MVIIMASLKNKFDRILESDQQGIDGKYRYHLGQDEINLMG